MNGMQQICSKELARVFKDKKLVFSVFFLPIIIMVGVMMLVSGLSQNVKKDVKAHDAIVYTQNAPPGFDEFLKAADKECKLYPLTNCADTKSMIKNGKADLLIEFPENFLDEVGQYKPGDAIPQIKTYYNPSEDYSSAAYDTISNGILETYRQKLLSERVKDMDALTVFTVNSDNPSMIIQDKDKAGGKLLGMMLPYFITILLFAGAMGIGTDMVAGEKERGTMASLLVSPIKRSSIVLGKVFALMIISGVSSMVYVVAMVAFMPQMMGNMGAKDAGLSMALHSGQIVMLAVLLVAIAFLYSAIIVLISVFAKTVKEASSYIMPIYMLILVLGVTTMFTTKAPAGGLYAIPIYNTSLTLQGILTQKVSAMQYGLTLGMTLVLGVILVWAIAKAFESEKVMAA